MVDDAINIRGLKRVAADFAGEVDPRLRLRPRERRSPSSAEAPEAPSAAYYLQLMGHQTTVYEMLPELGGMLRYGIPTTVFPRSGWRTISAVF